MSTPEDTLAATLAPTLLPHADRGASALVSGASRAHRRAVLDAVVARIHAQTPPALVIRVPVRSPQGPATRLMDELSALVEHALQVRRAPGGLYDDRADEATRSLAGWLFRARAVGHHGLVLVLDDMDHWLDARGARKGPQDAARHLATLLDETRRRALTVVASARAGEASGTPALPGDLVRRFQTAHVLGGTTVVTRDPGTLVAALGGRSFSLSSLRDATEGWLDLGPPPAGHDPDDTLIVFTSPLAAPVLETSVVEWDRVTRSVPAPRPVELPEGPRDTLADALAWPDALRTAVTVQASVRRIREVSGFTDLATAARLYRDVVAPLPLLLEDLAVGEAAVGAGPTGIARSAGRALARFDAAFATVYAAAATGWAHGGPRPLMLCDLPARLAALAERVGARGTAAVLLTGLRWDLWPGFQQRVLAQVGGLSEVDTGTHWADRPVSVATQRSLVAHGAPGVPARVPPEGDVPKGDTPWLTGSLAEALKPRREHLGSVEVFRLPAYAVALAGTGTAPETSLGAAARAVEAALPAVLRALCGGFAGRTAVLLASDVGSVGPADVGASGGDGRTPGGDHAAAVVLPYALMTWG